MRRLLLLLLFATPLGLLAQTAPDTLVLDAVEVTGVRLPNPNRRLLPAHVLDSAALARRNAASVADAVRELPGVMLKDYGGIGGLRTLSVRSLGANHTAVFLDGFQLVDAQTGQTDLGRLSLDNLRSVRLELGATTLLAQPARAYAAASTLHLTSRGATLLTMTMPYRLRSTVTGGSFGLYTGSVGADWRMGRRWAAAVSAEWQQGHGRYDFLLKNGSASETLTRQNADLRSLRTELDIARALPNGHLRAKLWYFDSDRGLPGATVLYNTAAAQRLGNRDAFAQLGWEQRLGTGWQLAVQARYGSQFTRFRDPNDPGQPGGLDDTYQQQEGYASAAVSWLATGRLAFSAATDVAWNHLATTILAEMPARVTLYQALAVKWQPDARGRWALDASWLLTHVNDSPIGTVDRPAVAYGNPQLAIGWVPFGDAGPRLRLAGQQTLRLPTLNDLYYTRVGNRSLRPERVQQLNLGLDWERRSRAALARTRLAADVYLGRAYDRILAIPTRNLFVWSMVNVAEVATRGLEVQAELETRQWGRFSAQWQGQFTVQYATDRSPAGSSGTEPNGQIPYTPFNLASTRLTLAYGAVSVGTGLLYTGFRYSLPENIAANVLPGFTLLDAQASWRIRSGKPALLLKAEVNNLTNQQYEVIQSYPMPGRSYRLALSFSL